jgi:hypothetical protein
MSTTPAPRRPWRLAVLLLAVLLASSLWVWNRGAPTPAGPQPRREELRREYLAALHEEKRASFAARMVGNLASQLATQLEALNGDPESLLAQLDQAEEQYLVRMRDWDVAARALAAIRQQAREEFGDDPVFAEE